VSGEIIVDLHPEYCSYRDEGCDLFSSCLDCPMPRCRYDEQIGRKRMSKRLRDVEILREHKSGSKSVGELAKSFGVSRRTVQRIIRRSCDG